jgi:hypothetical protein
VLSCFVLRQLVMGHRKGQKLLTLSITIKRDKVEAKVENSLYKLAFAFPCMIYF